MHALTPTHSFRSPAQLSQNATGMENTSLSWHRERSEDSCARVTRFFADAQNDKWGCFE